MSCEYSKINYVEPLPLLVSHDWTFKWANQKSVLSCPLTPLLAQSRYCLKIAERGNCALGDCEVAIGGAGGRYSILEIL